ncbi:MAG: pantetheine-phosphate adenylyltransferase [Defluviitaleaceae bacterium]|nr:pantetheine-phosphate adenylyltransferase [Defluviitaleaceae bacterium]
MTAVYPGSFDPLTNGHLDIITRASKIADKLIVAVLNNSSKTPAMFSVDDRLAILEETCGHIKNIEFAAFSGLLVDFAAAAGANAVIRGLRAVTDFEYEFQMAQTNRSLNDSIETLFISTSPQYSYLSSSIVKEVAILGGNVDYMVPAAVRVRLMKKIVGASCAGPVI